MSELMTTGNNEAMVYNENVMGAGDDVSAGDITLGRISVMQSMSVLVQDDKANKGEIINLDTEEVLGGTKDVCELILLKSEKYWIEKEGEDFKARYPATDPNELPWEEGSIKRVYHHAFYVLLPEEVESGMAMPYEIAFRSTDLQSAKKISKFLMQMRMQKIPSWGKVFGLTTVEKSKDKYKWYGTNVKIERDSTEAEKKAAFEWYNILHSSKNIKHAAPEGAKKSNTVEANDEY